MKYRGIFWQAFGELIIQIVILNTTVKNDDPRRKKVNINNL